jgi:RNA polymerase sigma-70 factor (ECF subfamily)
VEGRPPDDERIDRARRGDAAAYRSLVQEHQAIAFRTAYVITGNAADAEEAAQDGFVNAWSALARFRPGAPFRPWLLRIVANEARNRRRARGRRAALALRVAGEGGPDDAAPSPEAALLAGEERRGLLEAIESLRDEDREVLACRFFLGLDEQESAAVLGVPRGTVKSRSSRALGRLRVLLEDAPAVEGRRA